MQKTSSLFRDIRFSIFLAGGIFLFIFISVSAFAALTKDTIAPKGELTGGAFTYWLQEILVPNSLPTENNLFNTNAKIENPTVKKTHRLAERDGTQVAIGKDGKLGIGTDTPSQLLEAKGDSPRVLISSASQNPELILKTSDTKKTVSFENNQKKLLFGNSEENSFSIDESGIANTTKEVKENGIQVVLADQKCEPGFFVQGFLEDGSIDCGVGSE